MATMKLEFGSCYLSCTETNEQSLGLTFHFIQKSRNLRRQWISFLKLRLLSHLQPADYIRSETEAVTHRRAQFQSSGQVVSHASDDL